MTHRGRFAALAVTLTLSSALPTLGFTAIVERWQSLPATYTVVSTINDLNGDGTFEMLTIEPSAGGGKIGVRSCSTGALLAQSAATYQPGTFWFTYLEDTNSIEEIIFSDALTGNLVCMNFTGVALTVRWSFQPTSSGVPPTWLFVNFDGNALDMVFKDIGVNAAKYYIRNNNGALVSTIDQTAVAPGSGWTTLLYADDFNDNSRQELLIDYHNSTAGSAQDELYVFGSNAPAPGAPAAGASESRPLAHARPAVRRIDQVNGLWAEATGTAPDAIAATLRAVRLP